MRLRYLWVVFRAAAAVLAANVCQAQQLVVTPDRASGIYQAGDTVHWRVEWKDKTNPPPVHYQLLKGQLTEAGQGDVNFTNNVAGLEARLDAPGTMLVVATWKTAEGKAVRATAGAVASPERIALSAPCPDDFDAFWKAQLQKLEGTPANPQLESVNIGKPDLAYWKITMGNICGTHVNGQLARPAKGQKFPALLIVQWAGVYALQQGWVTDRAAAGWLVLDIEPHDLPIDQPEEFYKKQFGGPLHDYWKIGNDDRETSYYLRMYLSCYRAADYLAHRDDWDGKTLVVMGGSQGGMQSLVTAAIYPKITAALAMVPAGCDMLGPVVGRKGGWPQWFDNTDGKDPAKVHEASRYFDVANFTPRIKCPVLVGMGLIDETCPAAGVLAAVNQIRSPKEVVIIAGAEHQEINGSHAPYSRRCEGVWLPALREGKPAPLLGAEAAGPSAAPFVSPIKAAPFDLSAVRLLDGPFKQAQDLDRQVLMAMDPDRLLLMFRVTAGLPANAKPLGGWEAPDCELRGHTLGHYLSACALMYASTGDAVLKQRCDTIVAELAKCQGAMVSRGYHAGYLAAFPESWFDRVDAQKPVWAPWYTMHKIMAGLFDAHQLTGNPQALEVLDRLAGWVKFRADRLTPEQMQASLQTEHGGMNEVLANLYGVTNNPDHLRLAKAFNHQAVFAPLMRGEDALDGLHANTQIPKITGAAREFELTGNTEYRDLSRFFWQRVALHRSFAIGGHSDDEHFFPVGDFCQHLSPVTAETCNTYNMLKLTAHLFAWEPSAATMDFYERALYNHILASQDPRTGMFTYFVSMKPGHFKTYSTPEDSFWCCVGTGMENHARYGEEIYAHDDASLYVNLFIASELAWSGRGLVLRQETAFPEQPTAHLRLQLNQPVKLAIKIRQPGWCGAGMTIAVNGRRESAQPDSTGYVTIAREWRDGDVVEIGLPMALRSEPLPGNPNTVAFFCGPILLAGALGDTGLPQGGEYAGDQKKFEKWPAPAAPVRAGDPAAILAGLQPVAGQALTFRLGGAGRPADVMLMPFYRLHHQRYTIYWPVGASSN
jgi:uncharacterized protein